jgi:amino acid transporter
MNGLVLVAQFWTGFAPVGYADMSASARVKNFFQVYLAAPVIVVCYIVFKVVKKTKIRRTREIDVTSGRREMDLQAILAEERAVQRTWPWWKKVYRTVC